MFDLFVDLMQDRRLNHMQERVSSLSESSRMNARDAAYEVTSELSKRVNKLLLMNMALAELLIEKTDLTQDDIKTKIAEIDLRDGELDGKINEKSSLPPAKDCPECDAKICRDYNRCLFCGFEDVSGS